MIPRLQDCLAHHQAGRLAQAAAGYRAILAADPGVIDARNLLGVALAGQGDIAGALRQILIAVAARPDVADFRANLARLAEAHRDHPARPAALDLWIAAAPQDAVAWFLRGDGAGLERAVRLDPLSAPFQGQRATHLAERGQIAAAVAGFRRCLALAPALGPGWGNLATLLVRANDAARAVPAAHHRVILEPAATQGLAELGRALRDARRLDDAAAVLTAALDRQPDLDFAANHLIDVQVLRGAVAAAAALLESRRPAAERARLDDPAPPIVDDQVRFVVFDPGLVRRSGHHYNFDRAIAEAGRTLGVPVLLFANRRADDAAVLAELDALPLFASSPHQQWDGWDDDSADRFADHHNDFLRRQLDRLPADLIRRRDVVIFHTISAPMIAGFADWLAALPDHRRPAVQLNFMLPDFFDGRRGGLSRAAGHYRRAFATLAAVPNLRLIALTETDENRRTLAALADDRLVFEVAPPLRLERAPRPRDGADPALTVGHFGQSRPERGSHLVAELAATFRPSAPLRWSLQLDRAKMIGWPGRFGAEFGVDERPLIAALEALPQRTEVAVLGDDLTADDYYDRFSRADIVLLPYAARYAKSGSGVFREALSLGKVVVIPAGSSMAAEAADLDAGAVLIDGFSTAALADATARALADFPALSARALAAAERFRARSEQAALFRRLAALARAP